ncbi:tetratricopeptide repeat protein [Microcoleus sp. FACHB-1515]|uniref:tetratricopeptide repeat-containing sulfotransferase family protein n=1 Tax=Cyanophyceae TaxID=3028117 RepID=UPI001682BE5E|nr:tetratricopeptide repeat protein [Microcoleus sp. FACHB-1515]MBD2088469.1 tetratricopeptide repeat protein [Microcoleus sp. FACHB-1515]
MMEANTLKKTATDYFTAGHQLQEAGDLAGAIAAYQSAFDCDPNNFFYPYHLGEVLLKLGDLGGAIAHLQLAIRLNPHFSWSHQFLGEAFARNGQVVEAEQAFRQAIALDPTCSWSYYGLAEVLTAQNQFQAAIDCCCRSIELYPSFHRSHHCLRNLLGRHGQLEQGETWYRQLIASNQNSSWLHHFLGELLAHQNKTNDAIACFDQAIQLHPQFVWSYYQAAEALLRGGRLYEAIFYYRKVLELEPNFQQVYEDFYKVYYGLKYGHERLEYSQVEEVIQFHRQIIQLRPDCSIAYLGIGDLLTTKKGEIEQAIGYYQAASYYRALQTHPQFVEQHWQTEQSHQPDFLIIGTMKSGTTSLYGYLTQHPQIVPAAQKEIHFFDYAYSGGLDWYCSHFPPIPNHASFITGEATPIYFTNIKAIDRIANSLPSVKLIVLLRNPIARTISHYHHHKSWGLEQRSIEEAIQREASLLNTLTDLSQAFEVYPHESGYLFMSLYVYFLARWMNTFPKERVLVIQSEHLYEKPVETMEKVHAFLDVPNCTLGEYENYFPGQYNRHRTSVQSALADYFQPHNQRLEEYCGTKFTW